MYYRYLKIISSNFYNFRNLSKFNKLKYIIWLIKFSFSIVHCLIGTSLERKRGSFKMEKGLNLRIELLVFITSICIFNCYNQTQSRTYSLSTSLY